MRRYRMVGTDDIVQGKTFRAVVAEMAALKMGEVSSIDKYRNATARRIESTFGKSIDASTDEKFVKSLVEADLLESVE